jgi:hypothetical protein
MQNKFFVAQHHIEYFGNAPKLKKHNLTKLHLINLSIKLSHSRHPVMHPYVTKPPKKTLSYLYFMAI